MKWGVKRKGHADVSVSYETSPLDEGFTSVVFKIVKKAGLIHDIRFEGLTCVKARTLDSSRRKRPSGAFWGRAGKLNNQDLNDDVRTVEQAMQDKGYVYAKVVEAP